MRNKGAGAEVAGAKVPGGASGVPTASGQIAPTVATPSQFLGRPAGPKPKRYRVLNGGNVMFANVRTQLRVGKEVTNLAYDIAGLQRQGIRLEALVDDVEPEALEDLEPSITPATA